MLSLTQKLNQLYSNNPNTRPAWFVMVKMCLTSERFLIQTAQSEHRAEMKCTICEEKFYTSLQLEYHTNKVHGLNVYECENCPRKFYLQALCKRHNETVHLKIKPFQCEECSETFASKIQRLTHAVKVHNFSKFQCKICDRKFPGVNILNKHMAKKHSDVEPS